MIDYLILAILVVKMLPRVKFMSDHKGVRIIVFYERYYYSDPDSLVEGYFERTSAYWLKKNKEWWDLLNKG